MHNYAFTSTGDPSIFGNLKPHQAVHDAVKAALDSGLTAGYSHSLGHDEARKAVAKQFSTDEHPLTMDVCNKDLLILHKIKLL